jgi:hypothetical protein
MMGNTMKCTTSMRECAPDLEVGVAVAGAGLALALAVAAALDVAGVGAGVEDAGRRRVVERLSWDVGTRHY